MIKGLENGTFEDGLKVLVSPEKRWIGSDLITTFEDMKVVLEEGRAAVFHVHGPRRKALKLQKKI